MGSAMIFRAVLSVEEAEIMNRTATRPPAPASLEVSNREHARATRFGQFQANQIQLDVNEHELSGVSYSGSPCATITVAAAGDS